MKKFTFVLVVLLCLSLWGCAKENDSSAASQESTGHQHIFEDWHLSRVATCKYEGVETRKCTECGFEEERATPKEPHSFRNNTKICKVCQYVDLSGDETVVEMGNMTIYAYDYGSVATYAWDVMVWDGVIFRGAGDYDKNSGDTSFWTFDLAEGRWSSTGTATDEAIHRFVEIDGKLYAPGIDSRDGNGWDLGNYYVLEDGKWQKVRNVPQGIHCFDMIGHDGKMFIGTGTGESQKVVAVSTDKGESWTYLPMYKDGGLMDVSGHDQGWSRCYEFVEFGGKLYAMVSFKEADGYVREIFVYEGDKMVYVADCPFSGRVSRNYWQSKFEFNGKCYITANGLYAITDFAKPETHKKIEMPNKEMVSDAIIYNNEIYVLSCLFNENDTVETVIYKSATGEEGSFTEVVRFNYGARSYSFDYDGTYFYVGTGMALSTDYNNQVGMLLRVKP